MYRSVYDLKTFYNTKIGRVVRRILLQRIREFWPDVQNLRVAGFGYPVPYFRPFMSEAERVFAIMPAGQGAHQWPYISDQEKNLVALSEEGELPLETSSIDRILLIHSLEFSEFLQPHLQEIWRVLKSNGRLLVVVPSRNGLWARTDWSPFGQGTPYSVSQICYYLRDNMFVHERTEHALFMPPLKYSTLFKSAGFFEQTGRRFFPMAAGVHMVEATKQLYARANTGSGSKVKVRGRGFIARPMPQGFRTSA